MSERSTGYVVPMSADPWRRVRIGVAVLCGVLLVGSVGYWALGLNPGDAIYMTVITVTTVGYKEVADDPAQIDGLYRLWTVVVILVGVGTVLVILMSMLDTMLEVRLTDRLRRRRMTKDIEEMHGHTIVCGYGRLGRTIARRIAASGRQVVVIDRSAEALVECSHHYVHGDATDDEVLRAANVDGAAVLIAATDDDANNLYITLGVRTQRADMFIVARAKDERAEAKLVRAGADRVVNPQSIGGERIAALTLQPHVTEFLDVVMHEGVVEFRLEEVTVHPGSALVGETIRSAHLRDRTGSLVLAIRNADGTFVTNPEPETVIEGGSTLVVIGTGDQLAALEALISGGAGVAPA